MKKSLFALLMVVSGLASAVDVGVNGGGITGKNAGGIAGVTIGDHFGKFSVDAGLARGWQHNNTSDRWTLVGGYDIAKVAGVTITPKIGYAYLNNSSTQAANRTPSASAALVGVGASLPITKEVAATADYAYQASGNRNNTGNVLTAGLKYSF
jgi:outer membrane autotransporter protein